MPNASIVEGSLVPVNWTNSIHTDICESTLPTPTHIGFFGLGRCCVAFSSPAKRLLFAWQLKHVRNKRLVGNEVPHDSDCVLRPMAREKFSFENLPLP